MARKTAKSAKVKVKVSDLKPVKSAAVKGGATSKQIGRKLT